MSIKDPKKIALNYSVNKLVKELQHNFRKFDISTTFTVVFPKVDEDGLATEDFDKFAANGVPETKDLFKDYLHLSPTQVANSCRYFNLYTLRQSQLASDNSFSLSYFENNVERSFYSRVYSEMINFDETCWGGPLFFSIMMRHLTTSDEATRTQLTGVFNTYNINHLVLEKTFPMSSSS